MKVNSLEWKAYTRYDRVYDYLHGFVGLTQKQRLMDDLSRYLLQEKVDWASANKTLPSMECALVVVSEPSTHEIIDLGGSLPYDLFTDNFGFILSGVFGAPGAGANNITGCKDTGAVARTITFNNATVTNDYFTGYTSTQVNNGGTWLQLGSSVAAPARSDTAIGTALGTAPESAKFVSGVASYSAGSGTITVSGSLTSGGAGTINEAVCIEGGVTSAGAVILLCIAHDTTTATPYTASKSITLQYSFTD